VLERSAMASYNNSLEHQCVSSLPTAVVKEVANQASRSLIELVVEEKRGTIYVFLNVAFRHYASVNPNVTTYINTINRSRLGPKKSKKAKTNY